MPTAGAQRGNELVRAAPHGWATTTAGRLCALQVPLKTQRLRTPGYVFVCFRKHSKHTETAGEARHDEAVAPVCRRAFHGLLLPTPARVPRAARPQLPVVLAQSSFRPASARKRDSFESVNAGLPPGEIIGRSGVGRTAITGEQYVAVVLAFHVTDGLSNDGETASAQLFYALQAAHKRGSRCARTPWVSPPGTQHITAAGQPP